jgi:hypothetical protein
MTRRGWISPTNTSGRCPLRLPGSAPGGRIICLGLSEDGFAAQRPAARSGEMHRNAAHDGWKCSTAWPCRGTQHRAHFSMIVPGLSGSAQLLPWKAGRPLRQVEEVGERAASPFASVEPEEWLLLILAAGSWPGECSETFASSRRCKDIQDGILRAGNVSWLASIKPSSHGSNKLSVGLPACIICSACPPAGPA